MVQASDLGSVGTVNPQVKLRSFCSEKTSAEERVI